MHLATLTLILLTMPLFDTDHKISIQRAIEMTRLYRENKDKILVPDVLGKIILSISETFNRECALPFKFPKGIRKH